MATHEPVYTLTIYAGRSEDPTESTVLTPRAGAAHAESFILSTKQGVGTRPYLDWPRGRHGAIDPITKRLSTGSMSVRAFDRRVTAGGDNSERWVSAFLGDANGTQRLMGCKATLSESLDGGATFTPYFTGRVFDLGLEDALWITFDIRDTADDLKREVFVGAPHPSLAGATSAQIMPPGVPFDYGNFLASTPITGTISARLADDTLDGRVIERGTLTPASSEAYWRLLPPVSVAENPGAHTQLRAELTYNGQTGLFALDTREGSGAPGVIVKSLREGVRGSWVGLWLVTLPGHARYMAMPPAGATVTYRLFLDGPPTPSAPILIDHVHPVQLWADLLDGKYSRLSATGQPRPVAPRDEAAFDRLIADESFGTAPFLIEQTAKLNEFVEKHLCQPYQLGYRIDGSGAVVPLDLRRSAHTVPAATITDDDLITGNSPAWSVTRDDAVTGVEFKYYADVPVDLAAYIYATRAEDDHPLLVRAVALSAVVVNDLSTIRDVGEKLVKVDALGTRLQIGDFDYNTGQVTSEALERQVEGWLRTAFEPFATGATRVRLRCRRTDTADGIYPGTWCAVEVSLLPDPATSARGGTRLMLCVGRSEQGLALDLDLLDAGASGVAVPPSGLAIATVAADPSAIDATFSPNAAGDDVRLEYAVTRTTTATRPGEMDPAWTYGATSIGPALRLTKLPRGSRIWVRARSQPGGPDLKLPSAWVFSTPASLDLPAIGAITGISLTNLYANRVDVAWTVGDSSMQVEFYFTEGPAPTSWSRSMLKYQLGPGSSRIRLTSLTASTQYTIGLRHRDTHGGASAMTTHTFTTGATPGVAPRPAGIDIAVRPSA